MEDIADGKRRLIDAALRLAAAKRSFAALGLRELAREAGLNPNTFYRHFRDMEDLALTAIAEVSDALRPMLREVRWAAARDSSQAVAERTCGAFFAYAHGHADAFLLALCGSTGPQPGLRAAIRQLLADIAAEIAEDIERLQLIPSLPRATVDAACAEIVFHLFHLSAEYLEADEAGRRAHVGRAVRFVAWLLHGAAATQAGEACRAAEAAGAARLSAR
ncbi:TetR family transcriptional regulator [Cupriavidus sp. USMAA2-4]|uniref:TetR family transcriptional regulator n=1 Tax=Cupriavidus malaysiensis TaxID=367825 RepID=A0A1D9HXB1_9BURK|nr:MULTISPECIES: TetR family transcriptional regulator [Cupriavidus]AOY92369.1 TetR family transcriptional regulator [Cupriavidus sp. USMAA2-4]AOY98050.1 TetR family transcriptional regulator [Cupriavidus sp. USMAHM13]AOZ04479.1 TetR family transcriptional regulator [Cupriavidus malaysiensis]